ncbi:MAG: hypothetical protein ABEJ80_05805 [Halarchaeum sp.]
MPDDADDALDPDDLDITSDERVERLDDDRFVISSGGRPNVSADATPSGHAERSSDADDATDESDGADASVDDAAVSRWLATSFAENGFSHGFDATVKVDGAVSRHRMVSNDVTATFETLVLWYVRQVSGTTPPEETLGLLLASSDFTTRFPPQTLQHLLEAYDLSPEDSIADLVAAVDEAGGFDVD